MRDAGLGNGAGLLACSLLRTRWVQNPRTG